MVDWWQPLLYTLAGGLTGGLITAVVSYAAHRWTTSASQEAEERQAKRKAEEEQRQAIRQLRRERMQPVLDYLDIAKQARARQTVVSVIDEVYDKDELPFEQWREKRSELLETDPGGVEEMRASQIALMASASVPGLVRKIFDVHFAVQMPDEAKMLRRFGPALLSAERLIEQYLAGAEVQEPSRSSTSETDEKPPK